MLINSEKVTALRNRLCIVFGVDSFTGFLNQFEIVYYIDKDIKAFIANPCEDTGYTLICTVVKAICTVNRNLKPVDLLNSLFDGALQSQENPKESWEATQGFLLTILHQCLLSLPAGKIPEVFLVAGIVPILWMVTDGNGSEHGGPKILL